MCYVRRPTVKVKQVGEELLVLDEDNGQIHQLNRTASFIWNQCDGKTSRETIAKRMIQAFDVEPADAIQGINAAIKTLYELRLLTS